MRIFPPTKLSCVTSLVVLHAVVNMAENKKRRVSGKFCVAGGPGNVSCTSNSLTPGISMHLFPKDEVIRQKWTQFVQKHRPHDFKKPTIYSALCSVHFTAESFERRTDLLRPENPNKKTLSVSCRLVKGAIPTVDTANTAKTTTLSRRDKKQLSLS